MEKAVPPNSYDNDIKTLLRTYKPEGVRDGILSILSEIKSGAYTDASIVDHFDLLSRDVKGTRQSQAHITRTNLMQYVNDSLLGLPAERLKEPKNKERLEYVIRHIIFSSKEYQEAEKYIHEITRAAFTEDYKLQHSSWFLDAEKYRNVYNRLESKDPPAKAHVIEVLMVLGFDLDVLTKHLEAKSIEKKPDKARVKELPKKISVIWILALIVIAALTIIFIWSASNTTEPIDSSRPSLQGKSLFGKAYPVTISSGELGQTLVESDTILYEKYIETDQPVPLGEALIKVWLVNTSDEYPVYAHSIAVKSGDPAVFAGDKQDNGLKVRPLDGTLKVNLSCSRQTVYEWTISQDAPTLGPLEKKPLWIKVVGVGRCILPFKIIFRVQRNNSRHLVESDHTYSIALD